MLVSADYNATIYVDNGQQFTATSYSSATSHVVTGVTFVAIEVYNDSGNGGFILSLSSGGCATNSTAWLCTDMFHLKWNEAQFSNYSQWTPPVVLARNGITNLYPYISAYSRNCSWLDRTGTYYSGTIYCRLPSIC